MQSQAMNQNKCYILNIFKILVVAKLFSQRSDVSNFIGSDQKFAPYHLVNF